MPSGSFAAFTLFRQVMLNVAVLYLDGGDHRHPQWYRNLLANPEVTVRIGRVRQRMWAEVAGPDEKARPWNRLVAMSRDHDSYQSRTERDIPVVILKSV